SSSAVCLRVGDPQRLPSAQLCSRPSFPPGFVVTQPIRDGEVVLVAMEGAPSGSSDSPPNHNRHLEEINLRFLTRRAGKSAGWRRPGADRAPPASSGTRVAPT